MRGSGCALRPLAKHLLCVPPTAWPRHTGRNPDAFLVGLAERNEAASRATLGKTSAMDALAKSMQAQAELSGLLEPVPGRTA